MVVLSTFASGVFAAAALISSTAAHPGDSHDHLKHEAMRQHASAYKGKSAIDQCNNSTTNQELQSRNVARRAKVAAELRQKRGITTRKSQASQ